MITRDDIATMTDDEASALTKVQPRTKCWSLAMAGIPSHVDWCTSLDRIERPWAYADRHDWFRRGFDLFPRWTACVNKVRTARWRVSNAWAALHGAELYE